VSQSLPVNTASFSEQFSREADTELHLSARSGTSNNSASSNEEQQFSARSNASNSSTSSTSSNAEAQDYMLPSTRVRKRRNATGYRQWTRENMKKCLTDYANLPLSISASKNHAPVLQLCIDNHIPYATFSRYANALQKAMKTTGSVLSVAIDAILSKIGKRPDSRRFTAEEELAIIDILKRAVRTGQPLSRRRTLRMIRKCKRADGTPIKVTPSFIRGFEQRYIIF
jgi:hypothetical protein